MTSQPLDLPPAFEAQMLGILGDEFSEFSKSLLSSPPVSVRINQKKVSPFNDSGKIPWCKTGRYLERRPSFTLDPHFHAGGYYVQEPSSMFIEQAILNSIDVTKPLRVLDLCAAPGGKSTHLLSLISPDSLLVSNEAIRSRAAVLSENIQKWGCPNVIVTNNDPAMFTSLSGFFDVILVDAPCSGEGLFRKDPDAIAEWSPENVTLCSARQRRILQDVWPALKQGGLLIYCTCTYNSSENEENLKWLASNRSVEFVRIQSNAAGVEMTTGEVTGYRFFPHRVDGEGFFLSVVRKLDTEEASRRTKERDETRKNPLTNRLKGDFVTIQNGELSIAIPASLSRDIQWLSGNLNALIRGTAMGSDKHGKVVPEHSSALSINLDHSRVPTIDLTLEQALQYLRKETLAIDALQKGYYLVRFEGNALGWVNVLDNRINNLYPSAWRIRQQ